MHDAVVVGLMSFCFVFFKAFQQRNVAFEHYGAVMPLSLLMGFTEYTMYFIVAMQAAKTDPSFLTALFMGMGAGSGALLAIRLHTKMFGRKYENSIPGPGDAVVRNSQPDADVLRKAK